MKKKCWCKYPVNKCPNISCDDAFPTHASHRTRLIVGLHWYANGVWQPAKLWCEEKGEIHFCPVCGSKLSGGD